MGPDNQLWFDLIKSGSLVIGLIIAVRFLLTELKSLAEKRDTERKTERESCEETVRLLGDRVKTLEDRAHNESMDRENRLTSVLEKNASAFEKLAEKLP